MSWLITHKPAYDSDFVDLSKTLQKKATKAHAELEADPATVRGDTIKPLRSWENLWRYRMGNYRLVYSADEERHVVRLLAIGPRKDVYRRFDKHPAPREKAGLRFDSALAAGLEPRPKAPNGMKHPEWYQQQAEQKETPLPFKLSPARLNRWRVPVEHHAALMKCRTEDALDSADVPDEILERVMNGMWPPAAEQIAAQPDQLLIRPEDLERYAEGTLRGFLLHLDEHQSRFTDWALAGPTLVKGGPGSGKSTVALYRLRDLVERALEDDGELPEIFFATYTNPLISFSRSLLEQLLDDLVTVKPGKLPKRIRVSTVDSAVMWIARRSGECPDLANRDAQLAALDWALEAIRPRAMGDMDKLRLSRAVRGLREPYLLDEFEWVIEGQNCRQLEDYLAANRAGRGIPFSEIVRRGVWQLYGHYRSYLKQKNLGTFGQLRLLALDQVKSGAFTPRWDHVIIDEAQDLTPAALALCVELARDPTGVFLTADANQSLYNRYFRWSKVHDDLKVTGRTRILRRNYRSTRQIAVAAGDLLLATESNDAEAAEQEFLHAGPKPSIYPASGAYDQAQWLGAMIKQACKELRLPVNAAGVLAPSNNLAKNLAGFLQEQGLPARYMPSKDVQLEERCVKVMTLHAAKGLEFPIVAIAHVELDRLPRESEAIDPLEIQEHLDGQRRLLYVGCTRAMRHLFVTYDQSQPSPFIDELSTERWTRVGSA